MAANGYKIRHQSAVHFITFAVVDWIDVFTRRFCQDIIIDSLKYCQVERGLVLNAWCLMTNHLHFVGSATQGDLSGMLRDFKSATAKKIVSAILDSPLESRKEWMLPLFHKHGVENSRNQDFQFWQQDNQPKECFSVPFTMQKINYIHKNPVVAGWVVKPECYRLSSAVNYVIGQEFGLLEVDMLLKNLKE